MKLILATYFLAVNLAFAGDLWFSQMEEGDRIEMTEHSKGCFHDSTSYYEVQKKSGAYTFSAYAIAWDDSSPAKIKAKKTVGSTILTSKEVEGLDRLLKFYRGKKKVSWTTQVTLLLEFFERDRRIDVESLLDESGGYGLDGKKDVTTLRSLAQRFEEGSAGG